jgi:2-polyprenyl-3-methyl-5-hydroxy-6-metoxy-1,4-benzoquinol methylase
MFECSERFLFEKWIAPATYEDFRDKDVLECGCGGGQHTAFVAPYARSVTAVDLNTTDIARKRNQELSNVTFIGADISTMDLGQQYDLVFCLGVIHHTDDPDATFRNIFRHCKPNGRIIIWTYSAEGNAMVRFGVEPLRKLFLRGLTRQTLLVIAKIVTLALYPIIYTIYQIPALRFLPYFDYFVNFRRMSFERNLLNVFDKLNAPQTHFTTRQKCSEWFNPINFVPESISIVHYLGVSYTLSGIKRTNEVAGQEQYQKWTGAPKEAPIWLRSSE